ncbi:MAG: T9SS type A sorting domain-containing protein [Saprospiraceae bacterium]|nr:T9SS type A sorting domain-containing protein [Saprospiraceae bacterium]
MHGNQLILKNDFSDDSIDISKLKSGIYFLIIIDNNKNTRQYKFTTL